MRRHTSKMEYTAAKLSRCSTSPRRRSTQGSSAYPLRLVKETSRTGTWRLRRIHQESQRPSTSRRLTTRMQIKGVWLQYENGTAKIASSGKRNIWLSLLTRTSQYSLHPTSSGHTRTTHTRRRKAE